LSALPSKPTGPQAEKLVTRCRWCGTDPDYITYHDHEWGIELHDDKRLFEMLVLEGMQSGLSWITILRKRPAFRQAFEGFDPVKVAAFGPDKVAALLNNPAIIRHRAKIESAINNAKMALLVQSQYGSLDSFLWRITDGKQIVNHQKDHRETPATTVLSEKLARECKRAGFRFIGPTVAYAFMQAVGMVNDHETGCFRHPDSAASPSQ
jgi:DNA-3-methyladenine glycosylase I